MPQKSSERTEFNFQQFFNGEICGENVKWRGALQVNTPPETVPLDRTNGALGPLKWCIATAAMVH